MVILNENPSPPPHFTLRLSGMPRSHNPGVFETGQVWCVVCCARHRWTSFRKLSGQEEATTYADVIEENEGQGKLGFGICAACDNENSSGQTKDWDTQRVTRKKRTHSAPPTPSETPTKKARSNPSTPQGKALGDTPQKATTSTPSKVPRLSELDQLLQQLEQYVPSAPNFALPEELDASPPTDWKTKYQQLAGQLGGLTRAYHFIGKQGSGPLSQVEKLVLGNLVHRHVHNDHGMPCLSVPPFTEEGSSTGRRVIFVSLRHPSAEEALGKTMGRRYKQLWDLMEWLCHGDTPQLQDMHKRLFRDLVPKGVITLIEG